MRYAIYFTPAPGDSLAVLGAQWLGRDVFGNAHALHPSNRLVEAVTAEPRHYGLHATLKPPFALREGTTAPGLLAAAAGLAASLKPITIGSLTLHQIDSFLALVPSGHEPALAELAEACVRELDGFRRPAGQAELERRRGAMLTPRQDDNLRRWGYPYVFEDFRFHITLTRRLTEGEARQIVPVAEEHFGPVLGQPLVVDALSIFREPAPGIALTLEHRVALQPSKEERL